MKFCKVSWTELEKDCFALAKKLKGYKIDRILCISRGGLVWSRMLSDLLGNLPISHLTVESYQDLKQQKETKITELPQKDFKNETILVVDEIADQGKTFRTVINYLNSLKIKKFYTLSPYIKSHTSPLPDFYLKKINAWVIFPYEIRETYEAFIKIFGEGKAKKEMMKVGFINKEINSLLDLH